MKEYDVELTNEKVYLEEVLTEAKSQLGKAHEKKEKKREEIAIAQKEMRENAVHSIGSLYSLHNFYELIELNQYVQSSLDEQVHYEAEIQKIKDLSKLIQKPYFARIDFRFDGEDANEKIYIGLKGLEHSKTHETFIYDWRCPIAGVFYQFGVGEAFYEAPVGKIRGSVELKRQYEIQNSNLEYFFDAEVEIADEFLRKLLSQNVSSKMKNIVETIQKEQDVIIRDMESDLLMVQGVAGSGKTSIGLHRAAYLMYRGLTNNLKADNILILSPNTVFQQYISQVLPDLGEEHVQSFVFEEILTTVLQIEQIQSRHKHLENIICCSNKKRQNILKKSINFKASSEFATLIKRYIRGISYDEIEFFDIYYNGKVIITKDILKNKFLRRKKNLSLRAALQQIEDFIMDKLSESSQSRKNKIMHYMEKSGRYGVDGDNIVKALFHYEKKKHKAWIRKITKANIINLYKKLFSSKDYFYSFADNLLLPECIEEIIIMTYENLKTNCLQYDDALALSFFKLEVEGGNGYKIFHDIKQVVIDEAQDYYYLHFEILNMILKKPRYTVLGDVHQTIEKIEDISLYEQIATIFNKRKSVFIEIDKSFRCTKEIFQYSRRFLGSENEVKCFGRQGDMPQVHTASNAQSLILKMIEEINVCKEKGYESIALLCKTQRDVLFLYKMLKDKVDVHVIQDNIDIDLKHIFITPIYMSKGLEFDAVLIYNTDSEHYYTEEDRQLLYIGSTRPLHRLSLFYKGEASIWLQQESS